MTDITGVTDKWSAIDMAVPGTVGSIVISITGHDGKELADDDWIGIDHSGAFCHANSAELAWRGTVRDFKAMLKEKL